MVKGKEEMDNTIVEQLAVTEINQLILQPPFHLKSNLAWNDKGMCFDGDIEIYKRSHFTKEEFIGRAPVQVKGTSRYKKANLDKISHKITKRDLEVFYKDGSGVVFFVVTIHRETLKKQAFHTILAPLDLKGHLENLNHSGKDSISLKFKKVNDVERICLKLVNLVKRQPSHYIDVAANMEPRKIHLEYVRDEDKPLDVFNETGYVYIENEDGVRYPKSVANVGKARRQSKEVAIIEGEEIEYKVVTTVTKKEVIVTIEDVFIISAERKNLKKVKLVLKGIKTIQKHLNVLKLLKYLDKYKESPFMSDEINLTGIDLSGEEIVDNLKELEEISVEFKSLGIPLTYEFADNEDIMGLIDTVNFIYKKNNEGRAVDILSGVDKLMDSSVYAINLSDFTKIRLFFNGEKFVSFYSSSFTNKVIGVSEEGAQGVGLVEIERLSYFEEKGFYRVSPFMNYEISEMYQDINFNLEVIKGSFAENVHNFKYIYTVDRSLDYIEESLKTEDGELMRFALYLNEMAAKNEIRDIPMINILLIKRLIGEDITDDNMNQIDEIEERAIGEKDLALRFACSALKNDKRGATRFLDKMNNEKKSWLKNLPIYTYFKTL